MTTKLADNMFKLKIDHQLLGTKCLLQLYFEPQSHDSHFYHPQRKFGARQYFYTCSSFCSRGGGGVLSQHALQVVSQHALQGVCYPSMHDRWYPSMPCKGVCSQGGLLLGGLLLGGVPGGEPPPPRRLLLWAVCILLECILVVIMVMATIQNC